MPYEIIKVDGGFKVCKKDKSKCFSKKPIPKKRAIKQLKAIQISEHKLEGSGNDKYYIAIPSYDRAETLKDKTLKLLFERNIKPDNIYIFVANKEEKKEYEKVIPKDNYKKLIVGKKGISYQRNFIIDYFKEGDNIVFIDDDISNIKRKSGNKVSDLDDLNEFFINSFKKLKDENKFLWATKNMYNAFYKNLMKDEGEVGLLTFSGDLMGIINRKDMKIKITLEKGEGEQFELMLMYYKRDGGIIRFNNITVLSQKLTEGGKVKERGSVKARKADLIDNLNKLKEAYPEYTKNIKSESNVRAVLEPIKTESYKIEGGNIDFNDKNNDKIFVEDIKLTPKLKKLRERLTEELMKIKNKIPKIDKPKNKNSKWYYKNRGEILGTIGRTVNFGCGLVRFRGMGDFRANKEFPEAYKLILEYGSEILPKNFEYNVITLNYNMKAKKHKDSQNTGYSVLTTLGDYKKGGLYVYDKNGKNEKLYEDLNNKFLMFNGNILPHKSQESTGDRFTFVFYKASKCKLDIKPSKGEYPKLEGGVIDKETYLKRQSKGVYPANMTYEQFADIENKDRQRIDAEISKLNEQNKQYEQFIKENPEMEEVICNYDENGDPNKTRTTMGQCRINHNKAIRKANDKSIMGKIVNGLTDVGDFVAENLDIPIVGDIYKSFAPPTSKFAGNGKPNKFKNQLQKLNITEEKYLDYAKKVAKLRGYNPKKLELANDGKHKLSYNGVKFGAVGYNDFLLYLHQVKEGKIPFEYAIEKMKNYRARAQKIKGDWKNDKESPNNLAINIIW